MSKLQTMKQTSKAVLEFKPHSAQQEIADAALQYRYLVIRAGRRFGKALALYTPIMTTEGFKPLIDIEQGDYVFSELGEPVEVLKKSEVYTGRKCYKVQFSDGAEIVADASHDWVVEPKKYRKALGRAKSPLSKPKKLTTEQIASSYIIERNDGKHEYNYSIPTTKPLQLKEQIDRKLSRQKTVWKSDIKRRFIVGVEETPSVPVQCLTVDNPTHLFLAGKELIPTHNSALALNTVLREAVYNPGRYWVIAPEYTQAKSIYWRDLVTEYVPKNMIVKKNDNELILEVMTSVPGKTSIIEFKGSDREDKLRGAGLKGVVLDEYAFQKEHVWDKIVGPMLVQTNGWAIFITTPNGVANHFKKFWDDAVALEAQQDSPKSREVFKKICKDATPERKFTESGYQDWLHMWKTFHFTSYDNPLIKKENLDNEKARLTPEFFTQEYMAEFARFAGLIYTAFDDKRHVQNFEINENWSFYRAIDFGATDPNAVPFIGVNRDGVIHIFDELYINDIRTSEFAELIKQKSAHRYFVSTYADSAGKQLIMDLAQYGVYSVPVKKNTGEGNSSWIIAGINQIQQLFKDDKIIIHPRCTATIKEFMSYSWRKDRLGEAVNIPQDTNNHILDAFRYFIVSYKGNEEVEFKNYLNRQPADSITGY